MVWQPEIEEINRRKELSRQMGGPEKVAQQHEKGRLTARERISQVLDKNSFVELGAMAGVPEYDENDDLKSFQPSSVIMGYGKMNGRDVCIMANDFTVKGGSTDEAAFYKQDFVERMAIERKMPLVFLYEGAGGSVSEGGTRQPTPINFGWANLAELMGKVPVIAANMGTAAGWIAVQVGFSHFNVMTKNSEIFVAGPPLIKAALNIDIDKHTLGDYKVHVHQSGVIDNVAEDERKTALSSLRNFSATCHRTCGSSPRALRQATTPTGGKTSFLILYPETLLNPSTCARHCSWSLTKTPCLNMRPTTDARS